MDIEKCKTEITQHEGRVLKIYQDSLGYKTLGIGHLCQATDPEATSYKPQAPSKKVQASSHKLQAPRFLNLETIEND